MGATKKAGTQRARMAAHLKAFPPPREGESSMALETGQHVAWVVRDKRDTMTTGVSAVHRVFDRVVTYCGRAIPPEIRRLPPLPSLNTCSACERLYARGVEQDAVQQRIERGRASA